MKWRTSRLFFTKGNIPFSRVEEIASIIGLSIIDIIQEDDDTCTQSIACPYYGRKIRISMMVERDEPRRITSHQPIGEELRLNHDDGTHYRYKNPRTRDDLRFKQGREGME